MVKTSWSVPIGLYEMLGSWCRAATMSVTLEGFPDGVVGQTDVVAIVQFGL